MGQTVSGDLWDHLYSAAISDSDGAVQPKFVPAVEGFSSLCRRR